MYYMLLFFLVISSSVAMKFEPDKMTDKEKMVKKLVNDKLKNLKKYNVKKVVLINCQGSFIVEKSTAPGAWEGKDMTLYKREEAVRTTRSSVDQQTMVEIATSVKDQVVEFLRGNGFTVADESEWKNHPVYLDMQKLMEAYDEDKSTKYGMINKTESVRTVKVAPYDMRLVPDGLISLFKYTVLDTQKKARILEDTNSQAFVSVDFTVGYGSKSKPELRGLNIFFQTGLRKDDMGTKDKEGNKVYMFSAPYFDNISLKDILEYQDSVLDGQFLSIQKYSDAVLMMTDYSLGLFGEKLKEATAEYMK